jgi:hypothetical protein
VRPYIPAVFEVQSLLEQGGGLSLAYDRPSHLFLGLISAVLPSLFTTNEATT